jgi:CHASE3 domain sensor protein
VIAAVLAAVARSRWARWAVTFGVLAGAVLLFLLSIRRTGERAGRLVERLETVEKANDVQSRMLEAAARRWVLIPAS